MDQETILAVGMFLIGVIIVASALVIYYGVNLKQFFTEVSDTLGITLPTPRECQPIFGFIPDVMCEIGNFFAPLVFFISLIGGIVAFIFMYRLSYGTFSKEYVILLSLIIGIAVFWIINKFAMIGILILFLILLLNVFTPVKVTSPYLAERVTRYVKVTKRTKRR
ncbi:MAG: hypothetical protein DRP11_05165 [Candidatus Aenigmatarchaeota archaeon]|nr:MAG: hypothetical protein DRP11_05165 [Candidatus Aenigmarchaeota archaeon]